MNDTAERVTHTPGPWKWMDYPDGRKLLLSRDRAVIHCPDAPMACDPADERLIAAAPDLLAALRDLTEVAEDAWPNRPCVRIAKEAIAKAEQP